MKFKLDNKGQMQLISVAIGSIVGLVCIVAIATIYGPITANANDYKTPSYYISSGGKGMLDMITLVIAAAMIIFVLTGLWLGTRTR